MEVLHSLCCRYSYLNRHLEDFERRRNVTESGGVCMLLLSSPQDFLGLLEIFEPVSTSKSRRQRGESDSERRVKISSIPGFRAVVSPS